MAWFKPLILALWVKCSTTQGSGHNLIQIDIHIGKVFFAKESAEVSVTATVAALAVLALGTLSDATQAWPIIFVSRQWRQSRQVQHIQPLLLLWPLSLMLVQKNCANVNATLNFCCTRYYSQQNFYQCLCTLMTSLKFWLCLTEYDVMLVI